MTPDLDVEGRQALATARDWPSDFHEPTTWNVCGDCLRVFLGRPTRIQCRACAGRQTV